MDNSTKHIFGSTLWKKLLKELFVASDMSLTDISARIQISQHKSDYEMSVTNQISS